MIQNVKRIIAIILSIVILVPNMSFAGDNTTHTIPDGGTNYGNANGSYTFDDVVDKEPPEGDGGSGKSSVRVTVPKTNVYAAEVYSLNNTISNCYYKPKWSEVSEVEGKLLKDNKLVSIYSGFFDTDWSDSYKEGESQSRALEMLGYDYLLEKEEYDGTYKPKSATYNNISKQTAIMDIYKSIGKVQYSYYSNVYQNSEMSQETSPIINTVPDNTTVDKSRARIDLWVTRTDPAKYVDIAVKDGFLASTDDGYGRMTNGEFIVLLMQMMHRYGEPVMSDAEVNTLLQSYGSTIPSYLSPIEKDAWIYLKSRGIINSDFKTYDNLNLTNMLDMLMCVKDKGSRSTFKEVTINNVPTDLVDAGYYSKELIIDTKTQLNIKTSVNYNTADKYDYLVAKTDYTTFLDSDGKEVSELSIPSDENVAGSTKVKDSYYKGIIKDANGVEFYHFLIPISYKGFKQSDGLNYVMINTSKSTDRPRTIRLEYGGGVYYSNPVGLEKDGDVVSSFRLKRTNFRNGEHTDFVDSKRKATNSASGLMSLLNTLKERLVGIVYAETKSNSESSNGVEKEYTIPISNVTDKEACRKTIAAMNGITSAVIGGNNLIVKTTTRLESEIRSKIVTNVNANNGTVMQSVLASIDGEFLVRYRDLQEKGLFAKGAEPQMGDDGELDLPSVKGNVRILSNTREIVVGNMIYKIPKGVKVYKVINNALWVDIRCAYGWGDNQYKYCINGEGEQQRLTIETVKGNSDYKMYSTTIGTGYGNERTFPINVILKKIPVAGNNYFVHYRLADTNPTACYFVYNTADPKTGSFNDWLFIYYIKELADPALKTKEAVEDAKKTMETIMGYSLTSDKYVFQCVKLNRDSTEIAQTGTIAFDENFGYMYTVPNARRFSDAAFSKPFKDASGNFNYFKPYVENASRVAPWGTALLPIVHTAGPNDSVTGAMVNGSIRLTDINYNKYSSLNWGSSITMLLERTYFGKFADPAWSQGNISFSKTLLAPVGVSSRVGQNVGKNVKSKYYTTLKQEYDAKPYNPNSKYPLKVYWGYESCLVKPVKNKNNKFSLMTENKSNGSVVYHMEMPGDTRLTVISKYVNTDGGVEYIYAIDGDAEWSLTKKEDSLLDIDLGELLDLMSRFDWRSFTWKSLIAWIDWLVTWIIQFTWQVIPLVGVSAVTILIGLSLVSQNKTVHVIFAKTIDPVRYLTLGRLRIQQLEFKRFIGYLIAAFIGFAFCIDGNIIRLFQWFLQVLVYLGKSVGIG